MPAAKRYEDGPMRHATINTAPPRDNSRLDADVCALLVIQAELACLPGDSEHRQRLRARRDHVFQSLADRQLEQLDRIRHSLEELMAPQGRSQAA
jgi:hypothetical protein